MRTMTCTAARRRLQAFHDRELPTGDQIAIAGHLDVCRECAALLAEIDLVGGALRAMAPGRRMLTRDEAVGFHASVVNRVKAEREASFVARVRGMFDDMHLVYAGLGATAATMACVVIMLGMMRFASSARPDSLAAMVACLATPGSNANAVAIDAASHARWTARFSAANETAEEETVFALADLLTHKASARNWSRCAPADARRPVRILTRRRLKGCSTPSRLGARGSRHRRVLIWSAVSGSMASLLPRKAHTTVRTPSVRA